VKDVGDEIGVSVGIGEQKKYSLVPLESACPQRHLDTRWW
jgi:hypothetical protein